MKSSRSPRSGMMVNRLNPVEPKMHLLLSVGSSLGTLSRSASTNGISQKAKTLKCLTDRQKDELWNMLKANFILPPEEDQEKPVIEPLIKTHALKKMAELFKRWKN